MVAGALVRCGKAVLIQSQVIPQGGDVKFHHIPSLSQVVKEIIAVLALFRGGNGFRQRSIGYLTAVIHRVKPYPGAVDAWLIRILYAVTVQIDPHIVA